MVHDGEIELKEKLLFQARAQLRKCRGNTKLSQAAKFTYFRNGILLGISFEELVAWIFSEPSPDDSFFVKLGIRPRKLAL